MHNVVNWYVERPLDAASLNDQGIMEQVCSIDRSKESSDMFASAWRRRLRRPTVAEIEH